MCQLCMCVSSIKFIFILYDQKLDLHVREPLWMLHVQGSVNHVLFYFIYYQYISLCQGSPWETV